MSVASFANIFSHSECFLFVLFMVSYIMIKGSIQEGDITIVNIHAPNIGAPQYTRQMLTAIKGESDSNTIIVGDFNT